MNWEHFQQTLGSILSSNATVENCTHADLMQWTEKKPYILEFLTQLVERLRRCITARECARLYPEAEFILTQLSIHPFINLDRHISKAIIVCLLEYSKYNTSSLKCRSSLWCANHLRRLVHENTHTAPKNKITLQCQVKKIITKLDTSLNSSVDPHIVSQLIDFALTGLEQDTVSVLLEKLVTYGMVLMDQRHTYMYWGTSNVSEPNKRISNAEDNAYQALHFNTMPCILSEYFVSQLLNQHCGGGINQLWTLYRRWQPDLVARIWRHQSVIMEYEILDFFEKIATHTQYTSPSQLQHKLQNTLLFQTLHNNPILFSKAHKKAAEWLVDLMDWRILRVWQHTCILLEHPHKLRRENNLKNNSAHSKDIYRNFTPVLQKFVHLQQGISTDTGAKSIAAQCSEAMNRLLDYTYIGSFEDIELRRNEAWLLALSSPSFIQDCTSFCIAWCSSQDSWNSEMDDVSYYLAWLVCPSNDDRVDAEAKCMKRWLLSLKASIGKDPSHIIDIITKSWREIFNGNDVVAMSVFVSIITTVTSEWSMKAWVLMTDHLLEQPHEENSVSIYSNSSACILLDHFSLWSEKNDTQNTVSQDKKLYDRVYQLVEYIEGRLKFNKSTKSI